MLRRIDHDKPALGGDEIECGSSANNQGMSLVNTRRQGQVRRRTCSEGRLPWWAQAVDIDEIELGNEDYHMWVYPSSDGWTSCQISSPHAGLCCHNRENKKDSGGSPWWWWLSRKQTPSISMLAYARGGDTLTYDWRSVYAYTAREVQNPALHRSGQQIFCLCVPTCTQLLSSSKEWGNWAFLIESASMHLKINA